MRPLFADPKTDFVFKRVFGTEEHKDLLIALLDALLELDDAHRIVEVELLSPEVRPKVAELKHSIVDVRCRDARGTHYVVEMQVLNVAGFEKRVVYNVAKVYTAQLDAGHLYPRLDDVIGITICDFELWPDSKATRDSRRSRRSRATAASLPPAQTPDSQEPEFPRVPMLSRWRMQEQHGGARGIPQLQFAFLELPKYAAGDDPVTLIDKWAYFFRQAADLTLVPEALSAPPLTDALDAARTAGFTEEEWDAYIREGMALQDERGALSLAESAGRQEGKDEGLKEGRAAALREVLDTQLRARFGDLLPPDLVARVASAESGELQRWVTRFATAASLDEVFEEK